MDEFRRSERRLDRDIWIAIAAIMIGLVDLGIVIGEHL